MLKPYKHILILHAGLIIGAMAVENAGSPVWLLMTIVLLKLVVDFILHTRRDQGVKILSVSKC